MIFVTGATGRVGKAVTVALDGKEKWRGACRQLTELRTSPNWTGFDFENPESFAKALDGVNAVFLMRPPQIANARVFVPFLNALKARGIRRLVMLSVAGADKNPLLPHHGIEKLIQQPDFDWTILRPSDFMQNLETVHATAIRDRHEIAVPAGDGRSAFIDVNDIGVVGAKVLTQDGHAGRAYRLSGPQALSFAQIAQMLTQILGFKISYHSPSLWRFIADQTRAGAPFSMALIMSALYTVQRFGGSAEMTPDLERLLGRPPTDFEAYARREKKSWMGGDDDPS